MLVIKDLNLDKKLSVYISITFAKEVLHIFEDKYPKDMRPRKAIEAAEAWLRDPSNAAYAAYAADNAADAYAAYSAAAYAADNAAAAYSAAYSAAAYAADAYAAYSAADAADAAAAAAYAADAYAADAAADAASAAYNAADAAAYSADYKNQYIHNGIIKLLPFILEYKIENKQSFKSSEKVFEYLNDENKEKFLFNLDILR